ncbi:hypothetical protein H0H92_004829 [Tricholoma furcatifolium]|nr:hypothetical protein H0H92_004829 [Tricholoma furcatifolium]
MTHSNDRREPYIIASSDIVERHENLATGVLFELARLYTQKTISMEDITPEVLSSLQGNNAQAAPRTARMFFVNNSEEDSAPDVAFTQEALATSPWEELDREEAALARDKYAGLGHSDVAPGWYGGKVDFRAKLEKGENGHYDIRLERSTLGPSCRFSRRFGSSSILRVKADTKKCTTGLMDFFRKPFVLWTSVFRAFYAKDGSVFLFKTNERLVNDEILPDQHPEGLSLLDLLDFHNPMDHIKNQNQGMAKWSARIALGLSNSVPGPLLEEENIAEGEDIVSAEGSDMTDGCGMANRAATLAVSRALDSELYSVAFQCRLGGCKGMLAEISESSSKGPLKVVVRPSQIKIRYPVHHHDPHDPTLRIIEILRTSHMRSPARISPEIIINLADNGVPPDVFVNIMTANIKECVANLTTWEGPDAMFNLWTQVERVGSVLYSRRAREAGGEARARGLGHDYSKEKEEKEEDDEDEDDLQFDPAQERSTAWWADQISGCPSTLAETVMVLLDAGFRPQDHPILKDKLKQIVKTEVYNQTHKFRYDLPHSASAFVIPGPDEIHVKSSKRNFQTTDGIFSDVLLGEVLVHAVEHPLLRSYTDVIVCSVQGHRRLLDFLAGEKGDYDGDTAIVIWMQEIVNPFKNANEKYSKEPEGVGMCFSSENNEKVSDFVARTSHLSFMEKTHEVQAYALGALRDSSVVGIYSAMHDISIFKYGYSHPKTVELAYKFCKVLDGAKTGLTIRPDAYAKDKKACNPDQKLAWKVWKDRDSNSKKQGDSINTGYAKREKSSPHLKGKFIMDVLYKACQTERDRILASLESPSLFGPSRIKSDPHLAQPWEDAIKTVQRSSPPVARTMQEDLNKISGHVQAIYREHQSRRKINGKPFSKLAIEHRQDILRKFSKQFASYPTPEDMEVFTDLAMIARLRASRAFIFDLEQKRETRFPWDVALRDLCHIKANALGPYKTVTVGFYERFKLSRR